MMEGDDGAWWVGECVEPEAASASLIKEIENLRARLKQRDRRDAFRAMNEARRLMAKARNMPVVELHGSTRLVPELGVVPSQLKEQSATSIQARWRGRATRRKLVAKLTAEETELAAHQAMLEVSSAQRIQAHWRGYKGRQEFLCELELQEVKMQETLGALGLASGVELDRGTGRSSRHLSTTVDDDDQDGGAEQNSDTSWVNVDGHVTYRRTHLGSYIADQQRLSPTSMDRTSPAAESSKTSGHRISVLPPSRRVSLKHLAEQKSLYCGSTSSDAPGLSTAAQSLNMIQSLDSAVSIQSDTTDEVGPRKDMSACKQTPRRSRASSFENGAVHSSNTASIRRTQSTRTSSTESSAAGDPRVEFKTAGQYIRAGMRLKSYPRSKTDNAMIHSCDSHSHSDLSVTESPEESRMMVASLDSIGSADDLRAFAADMVCQFEYSTSMDSTQIEGWKAYPAAEQAKIKHATKLNRNTVNLGDRIIDLQSMTWSNSWTARQNVGCVRVKAINNYVGKEAAVCAIQKAWQESCGLGNVTDALRGNTMRFTKTIFYCETTRSPYPLDMPVSFYIARFNDIQTLTRPRSLVVMGQRGIMSPDTRQGWIQTETRTDKSSYRRRFYEVPSDVSVASLAGMLHTADGAMHGRKFQIVLSVTGGAAANFNDISEHVSAGVKEDVVRTAETYQGLVLTGGTSTGIMQLVGKALQEYSDVHGAELFCLGVAAASRILPRRPSRRFQHIGTGEEVVFKDEDLRASRQDSNLMNTITAPELRGHQAFLLVTDSHSDAVQRDTAAALVRAKLERTYAEMHRIPLATIVVGGGLTTLKTVQSAVQSNDNVFIVKGSGGIADALVKMYEAVISDDVVLRTNVQQELGEVEHLREHIFLIMQVCYSAKRANNLHIIDYRANEHSSCCQILLKQSIIASLGRGRARSIAQSRFAMLWGQYVEQLIRDKDFLFLLETLQAVFVELEANSSKLMGPHMSKLQPTDQLEFIRIVVLYVLRADLNTLDSNNVIVVRCIHHIYQSVVCVGVLDNAQKPDFYLHMHGTQMKDRANLIKFLFEYGRKLSEKTDDTWSTSFIDMNELYSIRNMSAIASQENLIRVVCTSDNVDEDRLTETFSRIGHVLGVTVRHKPTKTWALVSFANPKHAAQAVACNSLPDWMRVEKFDRGVAVESTGMMGAIFRAHLKTVSCSISSDQQGWWKSSARDTHGQARQPSQTLGSDVDDKHGFGGKHIHLRLSGHFLNYDTITLLCHTRSTLADVKRQLARELSRLASHEIDITDETTAIDDEIFPLVAVQKYDMWRWSNYFGIAFVAFVWHAFGLPVLPASSYIPIGSDTFCKIAVSMWLAIVCLALVAKPLLVSESQLKTANQQLMEMRKAKLLQVFESEVDSTRFLKLVRFGKDLDENATVGRCGVDSSCTNSTGDASRFGDICPKCKMTISNAKGLEDQARVAFRLCRSELLGQRTQDTALEEQQQQQQQQHHHHHHHHHHQHQQHQHQQQQQSYTTLPTDVKYALKVAGLLRKQADWQREHTNGQTQDMLLWSCAIADESLAMVFWEQSSQPIYAALVARAFCENLHLRIEQDKLTNIGKKARSVALALDPYSAQLHEMGKKFRRYADEMIAYTMDENDPINLGSAWHRGEKQSEIGNKIVEMAFVDADDDEAENFEHARSKHRHPALSKHVDIIWKDFGQGYFVVNGCLWVAFLFIQWYYVDSVIQNSNSASPEPIPVWLRVVFVTSCYSLTIETAMKHLAYSTPGRTTRKLTGSARVFFRLDVAILSVYHVSFLLEFIAKFAPVFEWCTGVPLFKFIVGYGLPALLRFTCMMAFLRILNIMSCLPGVRVVVNMLIQIIGHEDNRSFLAVLCTLAVAFSVPIYGVDWSRYRDSADEQTGNTIPEESANESSIWTFLTVVINEAVGLIVKAVDFNPPEGFEQSNVMYYYTFMLVANTYLVEGFLIGMINDAFSNRDPKENLTLDWRLNAIFDSRSTREGLAADTPIPFGYPPFNLISQIPELYWGLSCSKYGLNCQAEALLTRMLNVQQPTMSPKDQADLKRIAWNFKLARCSLAAHYLVAHFLFGPIVAYYFSEHIGYETRKERDEYDVDGMAEPSSNEVGAQDQLSHHDAKTTRAQQKAREDGIKLEGKALQLLKQSWNTKGDPAEAALVESLAEATGAALEDLTRKVQQIRTDNGRMHSEMADLTDKFQKVHAEMEDIKSTIGKEMQGIKCALDKVLKIAEDGPT